MTNGGGGKAPLATPPFDTPPALIPLIPLLDYTCTAF